METYAVYLKPRGSLASEVHSGTLFGAVCWAIEVLSLTDLEELLEGFNSDPPFVFSSAFPCLWTGDSPLRFYPRPQLRGLSSEEVERLAEEQTRKDRRLHPKKAKWEVMEKAKELEKAAYVSEQLFGELVLGQTGTEGMWRRLKKTGTQPLDIEQVGAALLTTGERQRVEVRGRLLRFGEEKDVQRNQIDRVAGATVEGLLFFERQVFLREGVAGLWFLARAHDLSLLQPAFRYLADTGIGGRRTTGKGQFDIEVGEAPALPDAGEEANAFVVLSCYLPVDGEWDRASEPLSYRLINLRGKHEAKFPVPLRPPQKTPPVYKELVRPFAEGSLIPLGDRREVYGQIVPVGQIGDREVWQNGLTVPVFARVGQN